jgi:hypothetical protein
VVAADFGYQPAKTERSAAGGLCVTRSGSCELVEIVVTRSEFTQPEIYAAMAVAGIPDPTADRTYKFTQTAWGRVFLAGLGVQFSAIYVCFNASGNVIESGRLDEEQHYCAALALAKQHAKSAGFQQLALMSAEVHAVNELLNGGSKAADIATSPAFFFLEVPTEAGAKRARQEITEYMAALQKENLLKKPWWRFW